MDSPEERRLSARYHIGRARRSLHALSGGAGAITIAVLLALRNLRLGRGDRRGAMRLSMFILAAGAMSNALETDDLQMLNKGPSLVVFVPAFVWLLYIALEPHIRRVWPETMIGWSRLLAGSIRDPLVGRDALVGVLVAIGDGLILALHTLLRRWSGRPLQFPVGASSSPFDGMAASSDLVLGGRYALSRIIGSVMSIPVWSGTMLTFLLLFALNMLLRRRSFAMAAMILGFTVTHVVIHGGWLLADAPADHFAPSFADVAVFAAVQTAIVLVAVRFGLLTMLDETQESLRPDSIDSDSVRDRGVEGSHPFVRPCSLHNEAEVHRSDRPSEMVINAVREARPAGPWRYESRAC